ncbi:MAG: histidine kinase, partial [Quadrisphaera sp.]
MTRQLSEVTDAQAAVDRLAHLVVPVLADFAMIAVVGDDTAAATTQTQDDDASGGAPAAARRRHGLRDVAWWHHDDDRRAPRADHRSGAPGRARRRRAAAAALAAGGPTGSRWLCPTRRRRGTSVAEALADMMAPGPVRDALLELAPSSMATWSLRSGGRTLGLLTVGTDADRAPLTSRDVDLGADIAARAGLALDRSRLFRQQRDLAEGLQRSLLTLSPGAVPAHVTVAVRYVAAAEAARVGGD